MVIRAATPKCTHQTTVPSNDKNHTSWSSLPSHHTSHIKPQSPHDNKNHTRWLSPQPHHTAHIKPQLLWWYKPHQLVSPPHHTAHIKPQLLWYKPHQLVSPPHHTAHIKPQLLWWYKPHQLVSPPHHTAHIKPVLRDDKNHTSWSLPPPHNTTLKGCQLVRESFSNVLISLPHQPAWEAFEEIEPSASVVQTAPRDQSSLFCKVLWRCPQSAAHTWNR